MAQKKISFDHKINASLQIGDIAYVSTPDTVSGIVSDPQLLGEIIHIEPNNIIVETTGTVTVTSGKTMYFLFSKPIEINESSLKGYYADVTMKNSSNEYIELFSISSEITPSSK